MALGKWESEGGVIILEWPDQVLNPNSTAHYMAKHKAKKAARQAAGWATKAAKLPVDGGGRIEVRILLMPPDKRRRDKDNMMASCKAILDGVADGLGVNDSRFDPVFTFGDVRKGGKVLVEWG